MRDFFRRHWWILAVVFIALLLTCTKCSAAITDRPDFHAGVRAYYQSEWQADGNEENPYVFQLDEVRLWWNKYHGNGTSTTITLEVDGTDQLVRFREAYVEKQFYGSPAGLRFGVYENPFGLGKIWDRFGLTGRRSPWIGEERALARLGTGVPLADAGAGIILDTDPVTLSADIFNGSGYKNLEWNEEKDVLVKAVFEVRGISCELGQYKSLDGPSQADPYVWNNALIALDYGKLLLTGQYITSGDVYGKLLQYEKDEDLNNRDQVFTLAGEYRLTDEIGLAVRGDKYNDGTPDNDEEVKHLTEDVDILDQLPHFLQGDVTQLSGGINYYLDGTGEDVLLQIHGLTTNVKDGDNQNQLVVQLSWVY